MSMYVPTNITLLVALCTISLLLFAGCKKNKRPSSQLQIGMQAPHFTLPDQDGRPWALSSARGTKVALYFYPKDQTPGCTQQACSIRDGIGDLQRAGINVIGVSYDTPTSHKIFKEKYHLNFPLLSDVDKHVAALYGVKGIMFAQRITFLIDEHGKLVNIIKDINVSQHADQIIAGFAS